RALILPDLQRNFGDSMHKRIATACSLAAILSLSATAAATQNAPVSQITESSSTATQPPRPAPGSSNAITAPPQQPSAPSAARSAVTDDQLQKFVASARQVAVLSQEYTEKLRSQPSESSKQQLVQEANQRMESAVQANGLTVAEFNTIGEAIERDPGLA